MRHSLTYRKRVIGIANQFIDKKINASWAATMRADQGDRLKHDDFKLLKESGLRRVLVGVESGSQEMLDWLSKDITIEQVYECAKLCKRHGIHVHFPFIVGFPGETDESVFASLNMARRLRSMSSTFSTPVFYFKPYPGSRITSEVVNRGFKLPEGIEQWGEFDYIGSAGPWVDDEKYRMIERFKFYNNFAWSPEHWWLAPLQHLARWRTAEHRYGFSIEKTLMDWLRPAPQLS